MFDAVAHAVGQVPLVGNSMYPAPPPPLPPTWRYEQRGLSEGKAAKEGKSGRMNERQQPEGMERRAREFVKALRLQSLAARNDVANN